MKKVININFQGRVIPIEESAYDILKQYVESLRRFFANEEGRDEIINDIEGRIAELFGESLKKGNTCITDETVNGIIASMGRPEDFEGEEANLKSQLGGEGKQQTYSGYNTYNNDPRGRLYRDDNDKLLGGVCGGIANYLRVDPTIVRLVFALIAFGLGTGVLLYILLWVILPSKPLATTVSTKRLYRNPDEKVIAGVASGIAAYFDIAIWIPRIIFALPLISGIVSSIFRHSFWWDGDPFPGIVFGSFGGTLFIVYAILWAVIPEANSASEKLEMRGERVDLNTIKNTIQEDLEGFKNRAEKWGGEVGHKAEEWSKEFTSTINQKGQQFTSEVNYAAKKSGGGVLKILGFLFKAFFLFIAGIIAFALLVALLAFLVAGIGVFPLKNFFLEGFWQNLLAWATLLLFLGVPVIGFITWLIRRIMGIKSGNKSLGFTFAGLWVLGLISAGILAFMIAENFDARARGKEELAIKQPATGKLIITVPDSKVKVYGRWFKMDGLLSVTDDSLFLNNVRIHLVKSKDSLYHIDATKYSNGRDESSALSNIKEMNYGINQQDSTIWLDRGFSVQRGTKFRNQGIVVTIQIPVGKRIMIDHNVRRRLNHFNLTDGRNDWDSDEDWNDNFYWDTDVEYRMTMGGLERVDKDKNASKNEELNSEEQANKEALENYKKSKEDLKKEYERKQKEAEELKKELDKPIDSTQYHYKKATALNAPPAAPAVPAAPKAEQHFDELRDAPILLKQMVL
ncbi:MAG: PspC domain-containing protein [Chitinophagaceae bacterium]|nr:PspC domain-containing protein [Chitinophagaceae bacterium]